MTCNLLISKEALFSAICGNRLRQQVGKKLFHVGARQRGLVLASKSGLILASAAVGECAPSFYAAIPPEEVAVSIAAAVIIRAQFAQDDRREAKAVVGLFDAIIGLLTGSGLRH